MHTCFHHRGTENTEWDGDRPWECRACPHVVSPRMRRCDLHRLHLVTYENGMKLQERLVALRQREEIDDQLLLLEHPPVITLGRGGDETNLLATPEALAHHGVRFYETTRG